MFFFGAMALPVFGLPYLQLSDFSLLVNLIQGEELPMYFLWTYVVMIFMEVCFFGSDSFKWDADQIQLFFIYVRVKVFLKLPCWVGAFRRDDWM